MAACQERQASWSGSAPKRERPSCCAWFQTPHCAKTQLSNVDLSKVQIAPPSGEAPEPPSGPTSEPLPPALLPPVDPVMLAQPVAAPPAPQPVPPPAALPLDALTAAAPS